MFKENSVDPHEANPTMTLTNDEQQNLGTVINLCDYPTTHIWHYASSLMTLMT